MSEAPRFRYRWWPRNAPDAAELMDHGNGRTVMLLDALAAAVFAVPVVARAVHIASWVSTSLFLMHGLWVAASLRWLLPRASRSAAAFRALVAGNLLSGEGVCIIVPMLARDPHSPLWGLPVVYAAFNGFTPELGPSVVLILVHTLAPLATMPYFLSIGSSPAWSIAGPVIASLLSFIAYHYLQVRGHVLQVVKFERDQALEKLREQELRSQRERIARELHDSVGASLAAAAVMGEMIGAQAASPEIQQLGSTVRDAAREGLVDLRGVLDGISPGREDAAAMCELLRRHAGRLVPPDVSVEVIGEGAADTMLGSSLRLVLLRCFQESLNNSVRHGGARRIQGVLRCDGRQVSLSIRDDGHGFEPSVAHRGRGLEGMAARARELGGSCELDSAPGRGAVVRVILPWRAVTPPANSLPRQD